MAGRIGRLFAFAGRAEPRGPAPSGWALAFDAAVAAGAAAGAVYEMAERSLTQGVVVIGPGFYGLPIVSPFGVRLNMPVKLLSPASGPHPSLGLLVAAALTALPLAGRRLYPITAWLAVIAAILVVHAAYVPPVALGTAVFAAYSAITHGRYRNLAIAVVAVTTFVTAAALGNELPRFPGRLTAVFAILPAAAAGLGIRELRRRLADSTARLDRAAAEGRAATERAVTAERARIASELHDVVTHNVSVMIVQAGAARKIMATSPGDAEDALLAVEATGREAMTELRNLLGLLSPASEDQVACAGVPGTAALRPQPQLSQLDMLIGRVSAAGLAVTLAVTGEPRPLPPGADLAAYRVIQEGLTNVLRHAGAAKATVTVGWGERLEITVCDDGPRVPGDSAGGLGNAPGRGLLGLRERVGLYGGELTAGPRPDGGWRVRAVLPLPGAGAPGVSVPGLAG